MFSARKFDDVVERSEALFAMDCDPRAKTAVLRFLDKVFYLTSMTKLVPFLLIALAEDEDIDRMWKVKTMRFGRNSNDPDLIHQMLDMKGKLADLPGYDNFITHIENAKQQAQVDVA